MTGLGLFLGGGGTVGVAWENGVLTGLREAGALEPTAATLVVGTSAGSIVGAEIALGRDPSEAIDRHEPLSDRPADPPSLTEGPFAEIIGLMMSGAGRTPEGAAEIGRLAVAADTALTTEQFLDRFRHMIGTDGWPSIDLCPTAADCGTGRPRIWTADDGIELWRAVASSCAIPGFFPAVPFAGRHYMDGNRGRNYHTAIAAGCDLDAALFVGPRNAAVAAVDQLIRDDMAALAATGVRVHTVLGSATLDASGIQLMDWSQRRRGFEIGVADGLEQAAAVAALLD
mgnify:FL=1